MDVAMTFDTHKFIKLLQSRGMPETQAEAVVETVAQTQEMNWDKFATKTDLVMLRSNLEKSMTELEYRLTAKLGGMLVVAITVVTALVKLV